MLCALQHCHHFFVYSITTTTTLMHPPPSPPCKYIRWKWLNHIFSPTSRLWANNVIQVPYKIHTNSWSMFSRLWIRTDSFMSARYCIVFFCFFFRSVRWEFLSSKKIRRSTKTCGVCVCASFKKCSGKQAKKIKQMN